MLLLRSLRARLLIIGVVPVLVALFITAALALLAAFWGLRRAGLTGLPGLTHRRVAIGAVLGLIGGTLGKGQRCGQDKPAATLTVKGRPRPKPPKMDPFGS